MERHHPPIVVISGAIGSGKGTIIHALVNELDLTWVPTHTTRTMRYDDPALSHRIFDTETNFLRHLARGEFIEAAEIAGHRYGLLRHDLEKELRANHPVVMELNIDGGMAVAEQYSNVLLLFILTDEKKRRERIRHRSQDKEEVERRMKEAAREERLAKRYYDYLIENIENHPEEAIETVKRIITERFPALKPDERSQDETSLVFKT